MGLDLSKGSKKVEYKEPRYEQYVSGIAPFLRGPYASMYTGRSWTIRQYAGFSTAEESNKFYRDNLAAGQKGLSIAFDLATHRGYDSDNLRVSGDVGMAGVAVDTVEDMKILFEEIPLDQMSVSMTMNGAVIPVMAFYIVAAEEQGVQPDQLRGTIQNDVLKEFLVRNTYIYPPDTSLRIISDIFQYTSRHMPKFNPVSVSGYHMQEAGATAAQELAYTLADAEEYLRIGLEAGLKPDNFVPRFSFFWGIGKNFLEEVSKLRVGRLLWASMVKKYDPANPKSMALRTHCQTSGWSLTAQDPMNNVARTAVEALAAVFGGTQSLHTNALDEAIALPTPHSAEIARNTQMFLESETDITRAIDPLGGSFAMTEHGNTLLKEARELMKEVESAGGMKEALKKNIPQRHIENAAVKRQAAIDSGEEKILGLNYKNRNYKAPENILNIDNADVRQKQIRRLNQIRNSRNENEVREKLQRITSAVRGKDNILSAAVDAARARATLGEISDAIEKVAGRYQATNTVQTGVYLRNMSENSSFQKARALSNEFAALTGRRPRIIVAKLGQDGHDRGSKVIATSFADLGFDVDLTPLFLTPSEAVRMALDHDVHVLGISSLAAGHKTHIPEVMKLLRENEREDIMVVVGGVIPGQDIDTLKNEGVEYIFGPGTVISEAAVDILQTLIRKNS